MKRLYIIRHGETDWNLEGRIQGNTSDIPLNSTGKDQARKTGIYLSRYGPFDLIVSSPMKRVQETTEIISDRVGYPRHQIHYHLDLKEKSYGYINGKTPAEIESDPHCGYYNRLYQSWKDIPDPIERISLLPEMERQRWQAYQVETSETVRARCHDFLTWLREREETNLLIVTHGHIVTTLLKELLGIRWDVPTGKVVGLGNCTIMLIYWYEDGSCELITAPTNVHLEYIE